MAVFAIPKMTVKTVADVEAGLAKIHGMSWDSDQVHPTELALHLAVLKAIADGTAEDPKRMAELAAETEFLDFDRCLFW